MKKLLLLATVLFSLVTAAPAVADEPVDQNPVDPSITNGSAAKQFRQARGKWLSYGVENYRFTLSRYCFCAQPSETVITVRDRKPVKLSARPWYGPRTVPGLFRVVAQAIKSKATRLDVKYDPRLGFVKAVSIDYVAMMADEEMGYEISEFRRLPVTGDPAS